MNPRLPKILPVRLPLARLLSALVAAALLTEWHLGSVQGKAKTA